MFSHKSKVLKIAAVYTGIVLGAGFASGQELLRFFVSYGELGFLGLIISGILFSLVGWIVLDICFTFDIKNYTEFMKLVVGNKSSIIFEAFVAMFILVIFTTMFAASGAALKEAFHINYSWGILLIGGICFVTFLFDLDGLIKINSFLSPILVLGGIFLGLYSYMFQESPVFLQKYTLLKSVTDNFFVAAITYTSYNIVTAITVLSTIGILVKDRKTAKWGGIIGGFCLCFLGICLSLPLIGKFSEISNLEIPLLYVIGELGKGFEFFYLIILLIAILTTAVANGFAFIEWVLSKINMNKLVLKILVVVIGTALAHIGFSNFVGKIYPLFGIIGFLELLIILIFYKKHKNVESKMKK